MCFFREYDVKFLLYIVHYLIMARKNMCETFISESNNVVPYVFIHTPTDIQD